MQLIPVIASIFIFVLGVLFSIIAVLFKKAIFKKLDDLVLQVKETVEKVDAINKELLTNYVRKSDFSSNERSHKELWLEIGSLKERITTVEGTASNNKERIIIIEKKQSKQS